MKERVVISRTGALTPLGVDAENFDPDGLQSSAAGHSYATIESREVIENR